LRVIGILFTQKICAAAKLSVAEQQDDWFFTYRKGIRTVVEYKYSAIRHQTATHSRDFEESPWRQAVAMRVGETAVSP